LRSPDWVSSMQDQVLLHERLAELSGGFLIPVVGYNPLVDYKSKSGDASLAVMEEAVTRHGCVGVKIYPPTGFSPFGNEIIEYTEADNTPGCISADEMKAILTRFYLKCQELDIPVMAHTNKSMGRDRASNLLAGPAGWKKLEKSAPDELKSLKVHLGHFGGAASHGKDDWTIEFAKFMNEANRVEPYGDVAFWNKLPGHSHPVTKLENVLKMPLKDGRTVASRTMYGSDWHMLSMVKDWECYPERVKQVLRRLHVSDEDIARIFGGNALACYGLTAASNSQNWRRLVEHYSPAKGRRLPGWVPPIAPA
jgi:predicted TIM-barrel fold metal-dependent hydrolase